MDRIYDLQLRSYEFSKNVVLFINRGEYGKYNFPLISQLFRSSTSIGANIIEARSGNSLKNFINFYSIALRSAKETKYWLCLIRDTIDVKREEILNLITEADEISKILGKAIIKLKQRL